MNSAIERLLTLRVADVMNTQVTTIPSDASMSAAAKILAKSDVRGAPVVDPNGRCVGVLSSMDFAALTGRQTNGQATHAGVALVAGNAQLPLDSAQGEVADHMSPIVQTVSQSAPIIQAARLMCQEHIHRLVIIDPEQKPVGMISSLDLVAAMIAAVEE